MRWCVRRATLHNALRDIIAASAVEAVGSGSVIVESKGNMKNASKSRPGDVALLQFAGGKTLLLDVTVTHALQDALILKAATAVGVGWEFGDRTKTHKYTNLIDDTCDFLPLPAETFGGWSPDARAFFRDLAAKVSHQTVEECWLTSTRGFLSASSAMSHA
jgi:hypothetical protein